MRPDQLIVTIIGGILVYLIYWFFFGKRSETEMVVGNEVSIIVDGGYKPQTIKIKKGNETKLAILRKDPNECLEEFILPDFKTKVYLPLNKTIEVSITPKKSGEYPFHCGMNMFHGKVVVE
jgi:plastocyanin domain-containing protein